MKRELETVEKIGKKNNVLANRRIRKSRGGRNRLGGNLLLPGIGGGAGFSGGDIFALLHHL